MTQRIGRFRRKTRSKMRKNPATKGKFSIKNYLAEYKDGDQVVLKAEPAIQKGMYFPRFHGKQGKVVGKQGGCYIISFKDIKKMKTLIVHPVHLKRV